MGLEDNHSCVHLLFIHTNRWIAFRLEMIMTLLFVGIVIVFVELSRSTIMELQFTAGEVGTTLNAFNNLLGLLQWGIQQSVKTEMNLTSVERLIHYAKLESEKDSKRWND